MYLLHYRLFCHFLHEVLRFFYLAGLIGFIFLSNFAYTHLHAPPTPKFRESYSLYLFLALYLSLFLTLSLPLSLSLIFLSNFANAHPEKTNFLSLFLSHYPSLLWTLILSSLAGMRLRNPQTLTHTHTHTLYLSYLNSHSLCLSWSLPPLSFFLPPSLLAICQISHSHTLFIYISLFLALFLSLIRHLDSDAWPCIGCCSSK